MLSMASSFNASIRVVTPKPRYEGTDEKKYNRDILTAGPLVTAKATLLKRLSCINMVDYYFYYHVKFFNLSIGSLGIFGQSCDSFIQMCSDLTIDKAHTNCIITKLTTIIIRTIYCIFCMRNKPRPSILLTVFLHPLVLLIKITYLSAFFFHFSLEIPVIRPVEYKLPIIREICICKFSICINMKFKK